MPIDDDKYIDDYLLDKLGEKEKLDFEKKINMDTGLQKEVEIRAALIKGVKVVGRDQLKDRLKRIHEEVNNKPTIRRRIWPYLSSVAAAIVLLIISWTYFSNNRTATSPEQLFAINYQPYALSLASRSDGAEEMAQLNTLYKEGQYERALPLFDAFLKREPENVRMLMGAGVCLLELDKPQKARDQFAKIIATGDTRLNDMATWYMALSLLKEKEIDAARNLLTNLNNNPQGDKYKEARDLLEEIKKLAIE